MGKQNKQNLGGQAVRPGTLPQSARNPESMRIINQDERILNQRVRDGYLELHCPGSMVHRIKIESSSKTIWEPVSREGGESSGRLPGEENVVVNEDAGQ